jgi:uncharacterized protein
MSTFAPAEGSLSASGIAAPRTVAHSRAMSDHPGALATLTACFILAGFVKGAIGMGLPTVAMGFLTLWMPPADAAAILILPSFLTNIWQLAAGPQLAVLLRRLWPMLVAGAVSTVLTGRLLGAVSSAATLAALGAALAVYAISSLAPLRIGVRSRLEPWLGPLIGAATGVVTAMTGVFVVPAVPYLQALRLEPEDLIQALGLSFTVFTVALAGALASDNQFHWPHVGASLLALVGAFAGMMLGQAVRARLRPATFRLWFLIGLLLLGLHLMLRAVI